MSVIRTELWKSRISQSLKNRAKIVGYKHTCAICGKRLKNNNKEATRCKRHRIFTDEHRAKLSKANTGKKQSPQTLSKLSSIRKGKPAWNKGIKLPHLSGEKSHLWKGGITPLNRAIRTSLEYREWRAAVFKRDNHTCQECGVNGVTLNADHIKPFAYFPELRFELSNGRTLCVDCHKQTDTYGSKVRSLYAI